jgi:hypothetical protein
MSNLQLGLAMLGGVILAGVVGYNAWITRKSAHRKADPSTLQLVASGNSRTEPDFDPDDADALLNGGALGKERRAAHQKLGLDVLIDVVAAMHLDGPVTGEAILAAMPGTRRVGSKPFAIEAQQSISGEWECPRAGHRYKAMNAGVQLANRHGALNEIEFSEFVVKVQALADALNATVDFPDMRDEVLRARELDQFASTHDAQLSFTLRAVQAAWSPGYVQQNAALLGFVPGPLPGRMVLPGGTLDSAPLLTLLFDAQAAMAEDPEQTALREVGVLLDVAHVPQASQAYPQMRLVVTALAQAMDGVITDDRGQVLSTQTLDNIGHDLAILYQALADRDLHAGSALARRLFS